MKVAEEQKVCCKFSFEIVPFHSFLFVRMIYKNSSQKFWGEIKNKAKTEALS